MKIGIIIYSQTGNTHFVAQNIEKALLKLNYKVNIEKIELMSNEIPRKEPFKLKTIPDVNKYDVIIFGSFVEAFCANPVIKEYLKQLTSLKNKKIICFVTQYFPYPWMGGNNAIKQMKVLCENNGADVIETGIVNWKNKKRLKMIENVINKIIKSLTKEVR